MGKPTNTGGNTPTKGGNTTTPLATYTKPQPTTPKVRKGTSTVPNPVGVTWVTCINHVHTTHTTTKGNPPVVVGGKLGVHPKGTVQVTRAQLVGLVTKLGVTYYTARTQVGRYMGWVTNGCNPATLPPGVTVPAGYYLGTPNPTPQG